MARRSRRAVHLMLGVQREHDVQRTRQPGVRPIAARGPGTVLRQPSTQHFLTEKLCIRPPAAQATNCMNMQGDQHMTWGGWSSIQL